MKKQSINSIIQISIVVVAVLLSLFFYKNFPEVVPIHWNVAGNADGFASRAFGAFLFPVILILIYILFEIIPRIDPRKENYAEFKKVYEIIKTTIMLVFLGIYIVAGLSSLGFAVSVSFWIPFLIGVLFMVLGFCLNKIRNNYFVGIRTPWTLSNEEVWKKTHILGGKLFVIGGVLMMVTGLLPIGLRIISLSAIIVLVAVVPIVYSYVIHKKIKNRV